MSLIFRWPRDSSRRALSLLALAAAACASSEPGAAVRPREAIAPAVSDVPDLIDGIVVDSRGTPVSGVPIRIGDVQIATTGDDGRWSGRSDGRSWWDLVQSLSPGVAERAHGILQSGGTSFRTTLGGLVIVTARAEGLLREGESVQTLAVQGPGLVPPTSQWMGAQVTKPTTQRVDTGGAVQVHAGTGDPVNFRAPYRRDGIRVLVVRQGGSVLVSDAELLEAAARNGACVRPAPMIRIDGVVSGAAGAPVGGADVEFRIQELVAWPRGVQAALHDLVRARSRADAAGRFSLSVLRIDSPEVPPLLMATAPDGRRGEVAIDADADVADIQIVVE